MLTIVKFIGKALGYLLLFLGLYVGISVLLSLIPTNRASSPTGGGNRIYVHSNGVHLDLIFPLELIPADLLAQLAHAPSSQLLAFGWGDKGFYLDTPTWAELSPKVAIKAMFLPSPTAMHVTEYDRVNPTWSYLELTDEQLTDLWTYVRSSFDTQLGGGRITELVGEGYTPRDRFYEAVGNYSLFKTCNTWVNKGLRRVGVKTAVWTPVDFGVLRYLPTLSSPATPPAH